MHPGRERRGRTRTGGAPARLLLAAVLALGVFMMHTLGHPKDSTTDGPGAMTEAAAPAHHGAAPAAAAHDGTSAGPGSGHVGMSAGPAGPGSGHRFTPAPAPSPHDSGAGMDMTTLCVAVLGAWLLAALVRAALARRPHGGTPPLARLRAAVAPHAPPPRPPDLATLSILRV